MSYGEQSSQRHTFEFNPLLQTNRLDQMLCPDFEPMAPHIREADHTIQRHRNNAEHWRKRFLRAAEHQYSDDMTSFRARWQRELNDHAAFQLGKYSNHNVNLRFAVLYQIAVNLHVGGSRFYLEGPDNQGVSSPAVMTLEAWLTKLEDLLEFNKRIVMDIIEGQHVTPFVQDPAFRDQQSTFEELAEF